MNDLGHNLGPIVMFLFVVAALVRRMRGASGPRPKRVPSGNSLVPTRTAAMSPLSPPAPARPVRRRLAEPVAPPPPPQPRTILAPAMGDMLSNEAAAAFPVLDLSLGDGGLPGATVTRPRARRMGSAARIGSRGWGVNAIVAAEVLGTPVGLRAGATVGVPHAF